MRTSTGAAARGSAWAAGLAAVGLLLVGCAGGDSDPPAADAAASGPSSVAGSPSVGGPESSVSPPAGRMDRWERHIAARLDRRLRGDGLSIDHLVCPRWPEHSSATVTCAAYLNGVRADVVVTLRPDGDGMDYDARITSGVVATHALERRVVRAGYQRVDCGTVAAYPAEVGLEVVCSCRNASGGPVHVVARVTDRSGSVEIAEP